MKRFMLFFAFFFSAASADCGGDCVSCHFSIDYKDERHKIMLDCKICHTPEKLKSQMTTNGCGRDCFECHSVNKINSIAIKEHTALNTCISCHTRLNNKLSPNINPLFNNKLLNRKLTPPNQSMFKQK